MKQADEARERKSEEERQKRYEERVKEDIADDGPECSLLFDSPTLFFSRISLLRIVSLYSAFLSLSSPFSSV